MNFELTNKQIDIIEALENLDYKVRSYTFSYGSGIGYTTEIVFGRSSTESKTLDITDYDTW